MTVQLTSNQVWEAMEKEVFAVLGMATAKGEARTVGIVYVVHGRKLYIGSNRDTWKVRHISANPKVSLTVPIAKRLWFMPWMKIPSATITFSGTARVLDPKETSPDVLKLLYRGMAEDPERVANTAIIEVTPEKDFVTYGVGISLMEMRDPNKSRGRVSVG
ncbi:MAG: pyridoxamine 5'-phosphate oxidase family protein [Caldilineaceae bacterium]